MPTREDAYQLMITHTSSESLRKHMLSVEVAMRFYARLYGEDEELYALTGLLHDSDYEEYPDLAVHTSMTAQWMEKDGYDPRAIYAILAHNVEQNGKTHPINDQLSRTLFACDEITGMITATVLVRPDRSIYTLEVSSVKKKMKAKAFAAGVNREDLHRGAEMLGLSLDEHLNNVIKAMSSIAPELGLAGIIEQASLPS